MNKYKIVISTIFEEDFEFITQEMTDEDLNELNNHLDKCFINGRFVSIRDEGNTSFYIPLNHVFYVSVDFANSEEL